MSWQLFRWVWRLESPLHIGAPPAGALNRTRLYVPARTLRGALIAEIARRRAGGQFPDYESAGKSVQRETRLSYLFPAEQIGGEWRAWLPLYRRGQGLVWEREEDRKTEGDRTFRMRLLITRPSTAIEPESEAAAEGTLREFELVSPYWRNADRGFKPVAMVGYLFCRDQSLLAEIEQIRELFVGGDTRYGLGHLTRIAYDKASEVFGEPVDLRVDLPAVTTSRILIHVLANENLNLIGSVEMFGGWDLIRGGLEEIGLAWVPGSTFQDQKTVRLPLDTCPQGE